jgi:hypothetical protein
MWRHRSRMSAGTHLKNVGLVEPVCMDRGPKVSKSAVLSLVAKRSLIGCSCRLSPDLFLSHCTHNSYNLFINMRTPHSSFRSLEKNIPRRKKSSFHFGKPFVQHSDNVILRLQFDFQQCVEKGRTKCCRNVSKKLN